MLNYEEDLKGVKRIVMIESFLLILVTACCGIVYGFKSGRWLEAVEFIGAAACFIALIMGLTHFRAEQRIQDLIYFSRSGRKPSDQNISKKITSERLVSGQLKI